jgi:salicylate hydroxylase
VSEIFAGAAKPVRGLVAAAEEWSAWSLHELPARTMTRGRIALLGDAAHPALPFLAQGGAMAIEDAASLALAVTRAGEDVPRALRGYEAERIGRVRRMQAAARRNGRVYHGSGLLALGRNLVMRRLGPEGMTERMSWVYGWRPGAA